MTKVQMVLKIEDLLFRYDSLSGERLLIAKDIIDLLEDEGMKLHRQIPQEVYFDIHNFTETIGWDD